MDWAFVLWAAVATALLVVHALQYPPIFEDAFISYRYADNLAAGEGLVFNLGDPVEGYTSFLWVLVLAVFRLMGAELASVAPWLSVLGAAVLVWICMALACQLVPKSRAAGVAGIFAALNGSVAMYAVSGMESTWFAALVSASVFCAASPSTLRRDLTFALLLLVTALARPEGVGYALLCLAGALPSRGGRRVFVVGALVGAAYGVYFGLRWQHFGYPLPNSYYAKQGGSVAVGVGYVEAFLWAHLGVLGVAGAALALRRLGARALPGALVLAGGLLMTCAVGGDIFPLHRFLLPVAGVTYAFAAYLVWALTAPLADRLRRLVRVAAPIAVGSVIMAAPHLDRPAIVGRAHAGPDDFTKAWRNGRITFGYERIAAWMERALPGDLTCALNAVGVIPYRTGLRTVDMLGLTDAHIAHRPVPRGRIALGHAKSDPRYVLERRPDMIFVGLPLVLSYPPQRRDLMRIWSGSLLPGDRVLLAMPEFRRDYRLVVVQIDEDAFTAFFMRRDRLPLLSESSPRAARSPR